MRLEAGDNAFVRFSETDAWSKSVEFLATSEQSPASSLRAGETVEVPVYVYTATEEAQVTLSYTQTITEAFPWSDIGASLKPSYVSNEAWPFALATLKSRFGATWNSYLNRLRANADYLAENGRPVRRLDRLLQIEINRALGVDAVLDKPLLDGFGAVEGEEHVGFGVDTVALNVALDEEIDLGMVAEHEEVVHEDRIIVADEGSFVALEVEVADLEGGAALGAFHVVEHDGVVHHEVP